MSQICCDMRVTYKTELETAPMSIGVAGVTHRTGSVQWTWIKTAEDHYDTIVMNEYRTICAHSAHLDLPKPKKSHANAKNEHGNSWPFSTLGPLHQRIVQTRILSCRRWLPNVHSHLSHKNCPLRIVIMKKEPHQQTHILSEMTYCDLSVWNQTLKSDKSDKSGQTFSTGGVWDQIL